MRSETLRANIVRPVLHRIGLWSENAEELLLGTAAQESHMTYLRQFDGGPALGIYQMEPATEQDLWENYLAYRDDLSGRVRSLMMDGWNRTEQMIGNLYYATAMARVHYRRYPEPLPDPTDIVGMAELWKLRYNTPLGSGTTEEFIENYRRFVHE